MSQRKKEEWQMLALMKDNSCFLCYFMEIRWGVTGWKGHGELGKKYSGWQRSSGIAGRAGAYLTELCGILAVERMLGMKMFPRTGMRRKL